MATHIYTSVAVNYLPKARVLAESIKKFHPDWMIHLVLCDIKPEWLSPEGEPFDSLLSLEELEIPNLPAWKFKHDLVELSTAVKGFALRKILGLPGCAEVFYFDPDIVVLSSLSPLLREFENASILLTPHLTEPESTEEAIVDNELATLQHGIYNLGFAGVKNSEEGWRFASWWRDRLQEFCYNDIPSGLFTDQRWADLVPAYFTDYKILRDPGYNVSTWNLTHRTVSGSLRDGLLVNGQPLAFYHFSGFDNGSQQGMLIKYGSTMPALFELREWYVAACERHGQQQLWQAPWGYGFFDNGERILRLHRKRYREQPEWQSRFPNPYATEPEDQSYLYWFELHGENRLAFREEAISLPSAAPQYRIFLIGAPGDAEYIPESVSRLLTASFQRSRIFLVVSQDFEISFSLPESLEILRFDSARYEDLFAVAVGAYSETDMIIVRAGVAPPKNWDLRLAWSAARYSSVLTVSPLDRRTIDPAGIFSRLSDEKLDQLCYWFRQPDDPETASFFDDCVYLRATALREMVNPQEPVRPLDLIAKAARFRYSHHLATHLCCAWHSPRRTGETTPVDLTGSWQVRRLRDAIRSYALFSQPKAVPVVSKTMTAPTLHVMHSWGGGVEQWLRDYSGADHEHENLVLKSFGHKGAYGNELRLYRYGSDQPELLRTWPLEPAIPATAIFHKTYGEVLAEIHREFRFERVFVSSLIGHALECLRLKLPTILICHDYYPFCSAINITFGEICRSCEKPRLQACLEENVHNRFFPNVGATEWLVTRTEFLRAVREGVVTFVAPSPSVRENYSRLLPELTSLFVVIPHGTGERSRQFTELRFLPERPLRVLVVGSLAVSKGRLLLESILPELLQFADVTLLGCHDFADTFSENPRLRVIPQYEREELPKWVTELEPEVSLLLSVVPETFSYTLRELQNMGVPSLATRLGSFADWIEDGVTGFLCAPEPKQVIEILRNFARDKRPLEQVHQKLQAFQPRSADNMVCDYARLTPVHYSPERYFRGPRSPEPVWERRLQLFWRISGEGFSEENSFAVAPLGTQRQLLRLYFPGQKRQPLHELRLDLSAQAGFFSLHQISLLNFQDEMIWNWNAEFSFWEAIKSAQVFPIKPIEGQSGSSLYLTGNDPWLVLPIPTALLEGMERGGSIVVDFASGANADYTPDLVLAVQSSNAAQLQATALAHSLRENLDNLMHDQVLERNKHLAELEKSEQNLRRSEAERAALQNSFSWRVTKPVRTVAKLGRKLLGRSS
jgi:glycosyltransferase involved in cell wall biosynthesis